MPAVLWYFMTALLQPANMTEASGLTTEVNKLIRKAMVADLATIMRHRRGMFYDIGFCDKAALDAMEAASAPFVKASLEEGSFRAWLAEVNGAVVAGGGLAIVGYPSTPQDPNPRLAWILNIYSEPEHRRRGFAKAIVETIVGWCRNVFIVSTQGVRNAQRTY